MKWTPQYETRAKNIAWQDLPLCTSPVGMCQVGGRVRTSDTLLVMVRPSADGTKVIVHHVFEGVDAFQPFGDVELDVGKPSQVDDQALAARARMRFRAGAPLSAGELRALQRAGAFRGSEN